MDISLKSEEGCQRIFEVKAPWEEIAPRFEAVAKKVKAQAQLPGFRAGKVPEAMVRAQFRKGIREDVLEHLLEDSAKETVDKFTLQPVVEPYAGAVHLVEGEAYSAEITIEVAPDVPEISAVGVTIESPKFEVTEEQLGGTLESIRQRAAIMKPLEGAAEEGDFAHVILQRKGQSKGLERFLGALSKSEHPVERALLGKKVGDEFEVKVEDDGHDHKHADEQAAAAEPPGHVHLAPGEYSVKVDRLARREVPELDDDMAKDLGAQSFDDLKARVRSDMEAHIRSEIRNRQEDTLIEALAAKFPFPVPPTLVDRQVRSDLGEIAEGLSRKGMDVTKANLDWSKIAESHRPEAQKKVVAYYLLDSVARRESIEATEGEVDAYFARQAQGTRSSPDQIKAQAKKDDRLGVVRALIAHRKAADLLLSQASITLVEGKPAAQETP